MLLHCYCCICCVCEVAPIVLCFGVEPFKYTKTIVSNSSTNPTEVFSQKTTGHFPSNHLLGKDNLLSNLYISSIFQLGLAQISKYDASKRIAELKLTTGNKPSWGSPEWNTEPLWRVRVWWVKPWCTRKALVMRKEDSWRFQCCWNIIGIISCESECFKSFFHTTSGCVWWFLSCPIVVINHPPLSSGWNMVWIDNFLRCKRVRRISNSLMDWWWVHLTLITRVFFESLPKIAGGGDLFLKVALPAL